MNRLRELYARSRRLPVRLRIAIVSAALTAIILIGFAAVVGRLVSNRLHNDFERDLQARAQQLASAFGGQIQESGSLTDLNALTPVSDALVRISYADGTVYAPPNRSTLGPPNTEEIVGRNGLEIASAPIFITASITAGAPTAPVYVQFARPEASVNETIGRLWLFLGGGVAIGTILAGLAGMAVANRAMRPIAALTATAGDIAATRDPSRRVPQPASDDEVAELARTFDQMLRELDAARTETEGTIKRQREFVADASHELRTPLTSILANLELLDHSLASDDEDERAAVNSALRSSKRIENRLVGDLLLLARADAGRATMRREVDLAAIADEALEEVEPVADGHHLASRFKGPAPVQGKPRRATPDGPQPARERHPPHAERDERAIARRDGRRSGEAVRRQQRRGRHTGGHGG